MPGEYTNTEVSMNQRLDQVFALARELNHEFEPPENWKSRAEKLEDTEAFYAQTLSILQSERDLGFFHPRHFKNTVRDKQSLSYQHCLLLTELIGAAFPQRMPTTDVSPLFGSVGHEVVADAIDTVKRDGVHILPFQMPKDCIEDVRQCTDSFEYQSRDTKESKKGMLHADGLNGTWWLGEPCELAAKPLFQQLAFDPVFLSIAQGFLGVMPIHAQTNTWWSFPPKPAAGQDNEVVQKRDAQWFHQDMGFISFVKVFVYLCDVGEENGPHIYVKGSADDSAEKLPGVRVSDRVSDQDIRSAFGADRIQTVTGAQGLIAIVNTRGYHKGAPILTGHRQMLEIEYTSCMHFNPLPSLDLQRLSSGSVELRRKYPRLFMNYRERSEQPSGIRGILSRFAFPRKRAA